MISQILTQIAMADPGVKPNATGLPGLSVLKEFAGALLTFGLVACVAGVVIGAVMMGVGKVSAHGRSADLGRGAVIWSAFGALLIGGSNAIVTFFSAAGGRV